MNSTFELVLDVLCSCCGRALWLVSFPEGHYFTFCPYCDGGPDDDSAS